MAHGTLSVIQCIYPTKLSDQNQGSCGGKKLPRDTDGKSSTGGVASRSGRGRFHGEEREMKVVRSVLLSLTSEHGASSTKDSSFLFFLPKTDLRWRDGDGSWVSISVRLASSRLAGGPIPESIRGSMVGGYEKVF
ncbi:hypothetical protein ISN45_Aa01g015240 [Arabidopsis thaliana x Arabidopsis arenosa]|uniref:Uncharacterized protein n=1 Tax=Arabidopsis thaliana x Arabidopsis arenosa TaxID=1240361 RepID=A0A8T2CBB7_9BRAS|nr:hypothetical protein ISN45_Aa01g015240 [Arabidopsis thaliana x Arabidopsis arenosa]